MKATNYYVINLKSVDIEYGHPYTLIFKGDVPVYGGNKLYTFKYDGEITETDAMLSDDIKHEFAEQLNADYGCGFEFDLQKVEEQLEKKHQYKIKLK